MLRIFIRVVIFVGIFAMLDKAAYSEGDPVAQGRKLFVEYCASCHGMSGEGDGPVARALITPPANLRRLSERFGNPLPEEQVARYIDGRAEVKAHGPRDMPVWGARFFFQTGANEREVKRRIDALVAVDPEPHSSRVARSPEPQLRPAPGLPINADYLLRHEPSLNNPAFRAGKFIAPKSDQGPPEFS